MNIKSLAGSRLAAEEERPKPPGTLPVDDGDRGEGEGEDDTEFYTPDSEDPCKLSFTFNSTTISASSAGTVAVGAIHLTSTTTTTIVRTEVHPLLTTTTTTEDEEEDVQQCPATAIGSVQFAPALPDATFQDAPDNESSHQQHYQEQLSNQRQLTPELIIRAEKEVNEKDSWRVRDIEALRDMLLAESSLKTPLDDCFLLRFLRARRFDYDGAFCLLCDYYRLHRSNPELFPPVANLKPLFEANLLSTVTGGRSNLDESVFLLRLGRWDPRKFSFDDILAAAIKVMEWLTAEDDVAQINGIVSVIDMTGFGWSQLRKFGPGLAKKCIFIMEKCLPIRIKTIFIINESTLADIGFAIIKPFMSEELHEKIQFCGSNLRANVHAHIHPDLLPAEYGGGKLGPMSSAPLFASLQAFEEAKEAREAGKKYGCVPLNQPTTPTAAGKCGTPSCGSRYSTVDEPGILGPNIDGTSPGGGDMKSIFRKSQTCNGYIFDYYNSTSID